MAALSQSKHIHRQTLLPHVVDGFCLYRANCYKGTGREEVEQSGAVNRRANNTWALKQSQGMFRTDMGGLGERSKRNAKAEAPLI